ncbi:MAG: MaoC family dehydratase N-terminal domain-containing protein [Chloroflexi bacterium]|nr:MaoC family dehydratase N-terminal domain-containing protein [Chloroflexota bacterium]
MTTESQEQKVYVTPEVKAQIGQGGPPASWPEPLDRMSLRRYVLATDDENPLYRDEEYARRSKYGGLIAPPFFVAAYPIAFAQIIEEWQHEHPEELRPGGAPAVRIEGLRRGVNAGSEIEWYRPFCLGDTLTWKARISDIVQRTGRSGPMVVSTTETEFRNQRGELVAIMRGSGIRMN